ncbi:uncharacterized protein FIESC28_04087 [Fusarium coffeatum]|uniref:Uncharacterized protein n=1 Tax=Fusarium coffeatum TaxID=231269 RepID=A0A366S253_9HYPO|nr:uncharacterized protein FIESC28_04087 [Fusarium coffeatum]RBR23092.1 hypothetical protein FIESC28_04087 [Fusarium coffeatum]
MSSQKRRIDKEAVGRAEEGDKGISREVRLQHSWEALLGVAPRPKDQRMEHLTHVNTLEEQIKGLRSEIEQLNAEKEKLGAKASSEDGASISSGGRKGSLGWLVAELGYVSSVASKLGLSLQKPTDHRELPILCGVICDKEQLVGLKSFMGVFADSPSQDGCFFCLSQAGHGLMAPMLAFGEDGLRCQVHGDDDVCVWISKREGRWVIGTSRG